MVLRYGIVDRPEARRVNTVAVPRGGGLAVCAAFLARRRRLPDPQPDAPHSVPVPFSFELVRGVALLARRRAGRAASAPSTTCSTCGPASSSLGQVALACLAVFLGISITFIANPFGRRTSSASTVWFAAGLTIFWIVGMINSINWIDGLDGLSSGIAFIAAVTLGIISLTTQVVPSPLIAVLCFALAGSLLGFLRWNFYPATIFSGTSGVQFVGYTLAVLAILGTAKVAVALLVLGVPIIDTFWIIVRRLSQRRSPFSPDRTHIHHRLLDLGLSHRQTVLVIYGICLALSILSMLLSGVTQLYAFLGIFVAFGLDPVPADPRRLRSAGRARGRGIRIRPSQSARRVGTSAGLGRRPDQC